MLKIRTLVCMCVFIFTAFILASTGTTAMEFMSLSQSVQSESLGNAVTAAKGLYAMKQNPASLASVKRSEINAQYLDYIEDISVKQFQFSLPTALFTVGMDVAMVDLGDQIRTTVSDPDGSSNESFSNSGFEGTVSIAKSIKDVSFGAGVSLVSESLDTETATSLGLNLGFHKSFDALNLGATIKNITLVDAQYDEVSAPLRQEVSLGGLYSFSLFKHKSDFLMDIVFPEDEDPFISVGMSSNLMSFLSLNLGYNGYSDLKQTSIGLELNLKSTRLDFAYQPMSDFDQSYRFGVGFRL
jgi:hypothetical protein